MSQNGYVQSEKKDKVCTITFYNPRANSLTIGLMHGIMKEINDASVNDDVKLVIIRGEGDGAFCAGASLDELLTIDRFEKAKEFFLSFGKLILSIVNCPKPVIARVHGKIVGGGVGLVAACDYAIAHKDASLRLSELLLGIGPFVISPAVIHKIGYAQFSNLSLDTEWRDAQWGKNHNLYSKVVDTIEELDQEIQNLTSKLVDIHLNTLEKIKSISWANAYQWEKIIDERAEISASLILSEITSGRLQQKLKQI